MNTSTSVYLKNVFKKPIGAGGYDWRLDEVKQFSHLSFALKEEIDKGVLAICDKNGVILVDNGGGEEGGGSEGGTQTITIQVPTFTVGGAITATYTNPASPYPTPATATYTAKSITALGTAPAAIGADLTKPAAFTEISEANAAIDILVDRINLLSNRVTALIALWTPIGTLITNHNAAETRDATFTTRLNTNESAINTFRTALGTAIADGLKSVADSVKPLTAGTADVSFDVETGGAGGGGGLITPTDPLTIPLSPKQFI